MNIYLILTHVYISHKKVDPPLHKLEVQKNQPEGWFLLTQQSRGKLFPLEYQRADITNK